MKLAPPAFVTTLVLLASATSFAEDAPAAPVTSGDYRWALYTSCTVAFALIVVWMIATHRRAGATADEVAAIERRLDELEKGSE